MTTLLGLFAARGRAVRPRRLSKLLVDGSTSTLPVVGAGKPGSQRRTQGLRVTRVASGQRRPIPAPLVSVHRILMTARRC